MNARCMLTLLVGSISVSAPAVVHAEQQATPPVTIAMSSAGGISKGAYQAGVDWTISEYLRRQRSRAFRDSLQTLVQDVPGAPTTVREYRLGSTSGASAGNINAVFAAMGWCTESYAPEGRAASAVIDAEDSLFWRTWINTGLAALLPRERNEEAAALSRAFIRKRHEDTIREFMRRAEARPGCALPVGLTLTRVQPVVIPIEGKSGSVGVQRFASIFNVSSNPNTSLPARLDFSAMSADWTSRGSLGALALLPELAESEAPASIDQRLRAVFNVMLASSAFPVAFAPQSIRYVPGGLLSSAEPEIADFSDGGFFDNNPIGLAVRLVEPLGRGRTKPLASPAERGVIRVAYSSPGNYRGPLLAARKATSPPTTRSGLGAAKDLLSNAFASARDYELQSLRRQIERDFELQDSALPRLLVSSRRGVIIGESLYSFGAFLGRPFREYDFYTGVYDGLEFIARHFVCEDTNVRDRDTCVDGVHHRLTRRNLLSLNSIGFSVTSWHANAEYVNVDVSRPVGDEQRAYVRPGDVERLQLLEVIHDTLATQLNDSQCPSGQDLVAALLCPGGLGATLEALAAVKSAAQKLHDDYCSAAADKLGDCAVDDSFLRFVAKPRRETYSMLRRALRNVERGERDVKRNGAKSLAWPAKIAYSAFRSSTMRYRDGVLGPFEFFPSSSSLGWDNKVATVVGMVAPGYLHNVVLNDAPDQAALGWQPIRLVLSDLAFVNTQAELFTRGASRDTFTSFARLGHHLGVGASIGTSALPRVKAIGRPTSLELGAFRLPTSFPEQLTGRSRWAGRLSARFVLDKVQVTVLVNRDVRSVSFGVSDLNGMAYWLLR